MPLGGSTKPIAYASRTLQHHERNYGITELEALAVVWAVKHYCQYLYGHKCHVYTDHEALRSLLNMPHPSGKLARWGLTLQELDLEIHYHPGKKNLKADALSCNPIPQVASNEENEDVLIAQMGESTPLTPRKSHDDSQSPKDSLAIRQREDPELLRFIRYLEDGTLPQDQKDARVVALCAEQYTLLEDVLY